VGIWRKSMLHRVLNNSSCSHGWQSEVRWKNVLIPNFLSDSS
jgi:hypothetical protein